MVMEGLQYLEDANSYSKRIEQKAEQLVDRQQVIDRYCQMKPQELRDEKQYLEAHILGRAFENLAFALGACYIPQRRGRKPKTDYSETKDLLVQCDLVRLEILGDIIEQREDALKRISGIINGRVQNEK
jgi:hypothetical protein